MTRFAVLCGYLRPEGRRLVECGRPSTHSVVGCYCCEEHVIPLVRDYMDSGVHNIDIRLEPDAWEEVPNE